MQPPDKTMAATVPVSVWTMLGLLPAEWLLQQVQNSQAGMQGAVHTLYMQTVG